MKKLKWIISATVFCFSVSGVAAPSVQPGLDFVNQIDSDISGIYAGDKCPKTKPMDSKKFCSSFEGVVKCVCLANIHSSFMCRSMSVIYMTILAKFGSIEKFCNDKHQYRVPPQQCIDEWNCYRNGGKNSQGVLCSGTGNRC